MTTKIFTFAADFNRYNNRMNNNQVTYHLLAIVVVAIWGTTFIASKVLLDWGLMPSDIFFYRFLLAYCCIWIISPRKLFADRLKDEIIMMFCGLFGGTLYFLTENMALKYGQASDVSIMVSSSPIHTTLLLSIFYQSERLNKRQSLGMLIAFIGMVLVILNGQFILHVSMLSYTLAISAGITWAFYNLCMKKVMGRYSSPFISRKVFFYGVLGILPYYGFISPLVTDRAILSQPPVWGCLLFLGILASMICYVLWNLTMAHLGAVKATVYLYLGPVFTIITAYLILDERITWMAILGMVVLMIGMVLAEKKTLRRK